MTYPNLKNYTELLRKKSKYAEIKESRFETEKHDYENVFKSLNFEIEYFRKKYKKLIKKNIVNYN